MEECVSVAPRSTSLALRLDALPSLLSPALHAVAAATATVLLCRALPTSGVEGMYDVMRHSRLEENPIRLSVTLNIL